MHSLKRPIDLQLPSPRPDSMSSPDGHAPLRDGTNTVHASINPVSTDDVLLPAVAKIVQTPEKLNPASDQPQRNGNSYFSPSERVTAPNTASKAAVGAQSPQERLRRLSLVDAERSERPTTDPRMAYPTLQLSGRIISATFCIPRSLGFESGQDWTVRSRRGTSALFDHFAHLSDVRNPWDHILIGWTGEIKPTGELRPEPGSAESSQDHSKKASLSSLGSLDSLASLATNKAAAPVPLGGNPTFVPHSECLRITKEDRDRLEIQLANDREGKIIPVWLIDELEHPYDDVILKDQARWRRYAEHELYTLFHYKQHEPTNGRKQRKWWADYFRMNQLFAERIIEAYQPGDIIWVHDYHLLLLPSLLRHHLPNAYIGFYLHIPFPSSEFIRCLTQRKEVLEGVLGANMISFQSYPYSRHFSSCCTRILGFDSNATGVDAYGAHVAVDAFPIGIDAIAVARTAYGDRRIEAKIARIREQYACQKIIVGRDRLDSVRGVAQKLEAFELFLEYYPEWRGKVVLIQVTSPTSVEEEKEDAGHKISTKISELVAKINGLYGGLEYTPVIYFPQYLSREDYFALLRVADVGLITSVRDGMNTTSLEYVVCQRDTHGPVILSEFSGTAASLTSAIQINPWNLGGVADAINTALTMPAPAKANMYKQMHNHVTNHTVQVWSKIFLTRFLDSLVSHSQSIATPPLDKIALLTCYRCAKKNRLFMFDYDGTLTPIVKDPLAATPSDRVTRSVKSLAEAPGNEVWIISGRDQAFLEEWMGHIPELGLSAEHGSFIRPPHTETWKNLTEDTDMSWQAQAMEVFQHYTERTQGSWIEQKRVALTWHFRRADPDWGAFMAKECKKALEKTVVQKWEVEVMNGKANLEVRPRWFNKGVIASRLVEESRPDFVFCAGDDFTDEGESFTTCHLGASHSIPLLLFQFLSSNHILLRVTRPANTRHCRHVSISSRLQAALGTYLHCHRWPKLKANQGNLPLTRAQRRYREHRNAQWK